MADNLQPIFSKAYPLIHIHSSLFPGCPIDNNSALVGVVAWRQKSRSITLNIVSPVHRRKYSPLSAMIAMILFDMHTYLWNKMMEWRIKNQLSRPSVFRWSPKHQYGLATLCYVILSLEYMPDATTHRICIHKWLVYRFYVFVMY